MRQMSVQTIKELYAKGERDFTGIDCRMGNFDNLNLSGSDFSESNASFSSFRGTNLSGCNFTKANIEWTDFQRANLTGANLTKARAWYNLFNNANLKDAILTNADMSWALFFNVVKNFKDIKGANFHMAAFHESEIRPGDQQLVKLQLAGMRGNMPDAVYTELNFSVNSVSDTIAKAQRSGDGEMRASYEAEGVAMNGYKGSGGGLRSYSGAGGMSLNPYTSCIAGGSRSGYAF